MIEIVKEGFTNQFVQKLSNFEHHADKTAAGSSTIKPILKSPASFLEAFNGPGMEATDKMRFGTLVHTALLEPDHFDKKLVLAPDFGTARSSINRAKLDAWKAEQAPDAIIVNNDELAQIHGMIRSVMRHKQARKILTDGGQFETSGYFRDPQTGIKCKIRPDYYNPDKNILLDLKTTEDSSPDAFSRKIWQYRYDFSMKMYMNGIHQITGNAVKMPLFLVVETKAPYEVSLYIADDDMLQKAERDYQYAMYTLSECIKNDVWPQRQESAELISLPPWALNL